MKLKVKSVLQQRAPMPESSGTLLLSIDPCLIIGLGFLAKPAVSRIHSVHYGGTGLP